MKKIFAYITVFALAALAAGCAKEESDILNKEPEQAIAGDENAITVVLNVPESPETKTILGAKNGDSYPVTWSAGDGDYLSLNGTAATASTKNSDTQYSATFKPVSGLSVYNFLYRGVSGRDDQVTFPSSQSYVANGFDSASMPMYASSASRSNSVTFNHLGALLKFSLTCNDTDHLPANKGIDAVTLTAEDENMSLSGTFTIGKTSNLLNGTLTPASGGASLTYSFGTHKSLSSTPFVFYIAIPAGTYEGGIKLTIVDNNGGSMDLYVMTESNKKTIAAGTVREFETVEYVPASEANLIMIYDDKSFLKFVNAVAGGRKTVNARVTKNTSPLTLSSETVQAFNSIEGYKGIFDGNNKAIAGLTKPLFDDLQGTVKNLTLNSTISVTDASDYQLGIFAKTIVPSAEVDDDPGLQNCTAEGSVNFTPSSALSNQPSIGGLVGYNKGGVISNCTNNATVEFGDDASVTHTGDRQPAIGGVVARSKDGGIISNCTNAGTVSCAEQFGGNIYIGGVLGFSEAKADAISSCTNGGLVKVLASGFTSGALHIGGVVGLGKCTIETCSNLAAGTVTTEACSVGTYLCQGGVIGRISGTTASYSGLANAGNINVAAAGAATGSYIGGIVGRCNEGASLSDCTNTGGTIEFTGDDSTCELHIGGIVGNTNKPVSNCTNGTAIIAGGTYSYNSSGKYYSVGGIVGYQKSDEALTNNTNTAAVTFSGTATGYAAVGGVVGYCNGAISGGGNSGTVTFSGSSNKQNVPIGGVAARTPGSKSGDRISGVTNSGAIVINTSTQTGKSVYVGGVVGHHQSGDFTATNSGTLTVTSLTCTNLILGGLIGQAAGAILSGSANQAAGDITISGLTSNQDSYVAGVVGKCTSTVTANNAGDVVLTSGSKASRSLFVGGVVGRSEGALTSCTNSGLVSNAAPMNGGSDYFMQIGGVVGYNNGSSPLSNCHNTGDVINTADSKSYLFVGGITSESDGDLTNCDNTGNITNTGDITANTKWINIGGVAGKANSTLTGCSNGTASAAGGTISNSGTSNEDVNIGGVAGLNEGRTFNSCFNKGDVNNSGNSKSGGYNINIGGLAGWSSANSTYVTCYNLGNITNTGLGTNSDAGVRMGGLVGSASGANNLSGTSSAYNYNQGVLVEDSASENVAVGGVCGYTFTAASNFNYCKSIGPEPTSQDDIWIQNNTKNKVYVGGIIGKSGVTSSMDNTSNSSDIVFNSNTLSATGQVFAGGIIGGWSASGTQTITGCTNTGWVYTLNASETEKGGEGGHLDAADSDNKPTYWSCFGGIAGMGAGTSQNLASSWNNITGKTFTNCTNTGYILIFAQLRCCVGGIVAYTENDPNGCVCTGKIRLKESGIGNVDGNYHRGICGGVVGLFTGNKASNLKFNRTIISNGSSPFAYTGGILGYVPAGTIELENCKVGGTVWATGSGDGRSALMCHAAQNEVSVTFTNCVVKSGTLSYATGSKVSINDSNIAANHCLGPGSNYTVEDDVLPSVETSI